MLPSENPSRTVQAVCAYWLTSSEGSSARAGGDPSRKVSVMIVISASVAFICDLAPVGRQSTEQTEKGGEAEDYAAPIALM